MWWWPWCDDVVVTTMMMMTMTMIMIMIMIMTIVSVEQRPGWGEHVLCRSCCVLSSSMARCNDWLGDGVMSNSLLLALQHINIWLVAVANKLCWLNPLSQVVCRVETIVLTRFCRFALERIFTLERISQLWILVGIDTRIFLICMGLGPLFPPRKKWFCSRLFGRRPHKEPYLPQQSPGNPSRFAFGRLGWSLPAVLWPGGWCRQLCPGCSDGMETQTMMVGTGHQDGEKVDTMR